jgi:hypothetical protein
MPQLERSNCVIQFTDDQHADVYKLFPVDNWRVKRLLEGINGVLQKRLDTTHVRAKHDMLDIIRTARKAHPTRQVFVCLCDMLMWTLESDQIDESDGELRPRPHPVPQHFR